MTGGKRTRMNRAEARVFELEARLTIAEQERDAQQDRGDALEEFARIQRERAEASQAKVVRLQAFIDTLADRALSTPEGSEG